MAIELITKFAPYVDEQFSTESKKEALTNQDFDWTGAKSVKVYKVSTSAMNDYGRVGCSDGNWSRYGAVKNLDATTSEYQIMKDRSFTFVIDALDEDETAQTLNAATALARQIREMVIPEVDSYTYAVMCENAGHKPVKKPLTEQNIYEEIIAANNALDNAEVPEIGRYILVTPDTYILMKKCKDIIMETEIGSDMRLQGVVSNLDGAFVIKIPAIRLPADFGFMVCHPCATVAPTKLESYNTHLNPPGISGQLVEGRIVYDAFVIDNKKNAIYYQEIGTQK